MSNENYSTEEILQFAIKNGILNLSSIQEEINMKSRKEYLKKHMFNIWQGKNGFWYTYMPDVEKGRKLKKKQTQKEIEDLVIKYQKELEKQEEEKQITLKTIFPEWLDYKTVHTNSTSYVKRITSEWYKYYEGVSDKLINKPITELEKLELDEWAHGLIKQFSMTKKKYYNMSIIIRQVLDYAVEKGYVDKNIFPSVKINTKLFAKQKKPQSEEQVYLVDEIPLIINEMERRFKNRPFDTTPLAVILDFEIGIRTGEMMALRFSDIKGNYLHIQRQEIRVYKKCEDGLKMKFSHFDVAEYTKSDDGERDIYLTKNARAIIERIKETNKKYGNKCEDYIFCVNNKRSNQYTVRDRIYRGCNTIGIQVKTMHKIRKTWVSTLVDSKLNIDEIRRQAGHADEKTTYKNYCFNRQSNNVSENIIELALAK